MPNGDGKINPSNGLVREAYSGLEAKNCVEIRFAGAFRCASGQWSLHYRLKGDVLIPGEGTPRRLPVDRIISIMTCQVGRKPRKRKDQP